MSGDEAAGATRQWPAGLLVLDKPPRMTSRDVVNAVARLVGRRTRVGHAGTLDPLATGVLVVALGSATRLIEHVQRMTKSYTAGIRLGARSDTDDADGRIELVPEARQPTSTAISEALSRQTGTILQQPPRFSALKVQGRRAYDLARQGQDLELQAREVRIDRIDVLRYAWPDLEIQVECGSGTYIRSIARELGEQLGCGGFISELRRTRIGPFDEAAAVAVPGLSSEIIAGALQPAREAVYNLPAVVLSEDQLGRVAQGRAILAPGAEPVEAGAEVALLTAAGEVAAIARREGELLRPHRVLLSPPPA